MDALTFLDGTEKRKVRPVYVLHGDEHFLKRHVLDAIRKLVLGEDDDGFGYTSFAGDKTTFAEVHAELSTLPFFGSKRLVVVNAADPFITKARDKLEDYAKEPSKTGVLVLEVASFPATTRLAKMLGEGGINCKAPTSRALTDWCVRWCASQHGKQLAPQAAALLVNLVGADMGMLDQELTKVALYVGDRSTRIEAKDVDKLVGASREEETWQIFDMIGAGKTAEALAHLDRLLTQGEEPLKLLGAFSWQLRRLAQVGRLCTHNHSLGQAMDRAGVQPFARKGVEQQLRYLGRNRLNHIYDWLLQVDMGIKGSSQLPPRTLLERLVVLLARK
jgi:DNA polymerase-3 subunit delta